MIESTNEADAMQDLEAALERVLAVHGFRFGERAEIRITRRPGVLALLEADDDRGPTPRLLLACDSRQPAEYGRRLELQV